jgi:hypothetical protein
MAQLRKFEKFYDLIKYLFKKQEKEKNDKRTRRDVGRNIEEITTTESFNTKET